MRKGINILLVGLLSLTISVAYINLNHEVSSTPDSGYDYDYDSGGSDFGGGSDYDGGSSYDYDRGGSDGYYNGEPQPFDWKAFLAIFSVFAFGCLITILLTLYDRHHEKKEITKYELKHKNNKLDYQYRSVLDRAFIVYRDIQSAWSNFDYETLRSLLTDELYNNYVTLLEQMKLKNQQNIMGSINLKDITMRNVTDLGDSYKYDVEMIVRQIDYILDTSINKIVRGNNDLHTVYYRITFIESKNKETVCPNCSSKLESVASQVCPYCGSVVTGNSHDLVMAKKEVIRQ